jgi:hypothetical protein
MAIFFHQPKTHLHKRRFHPVCIRGMLIHQQRLEFPDLVGKYPIVFLMEVRDQCPIQQPGGREDHRKRRTGIPDGQPGRDRP